jgi:hypothetical protein
VRRDRRLAALRAPRLTGQLRRPVPSEHSSGQSRRLGKITKAGSTHARRLLVEAALHYRLTPAVGGKLAVRQRGPDPALIDHAWRVQRRRNACRNSLRNGRGKPAGIVTIAIARELVAACREIATAPNHQDITPGASRRRGGPGIRAHTNVRAFAREPGRRPARFQTADAATNRAPETHRGRAYQADQASRRPAPRAAPTRQTHTPPSTTATSGHDHSYALDTSTPI